ncbi:ubiquitin-activating enzyme-like protein [Lotmaria passim]
MEVCVGHIVVPRKAASTELREGDTQEPMTKKARPDSALTNASNFSDSTGADVVVVSSQLSVESLREALRHYALRKLEENDSAGNAAKVPAAAGALKEVQTRLRDTTASWPVVVPPPSSSRTSSTPWATWSFCFMPHVLKQEEDSTLGGTPAEVVATHTKTPPSCLHSRDASMCLRDASTCAVLAAIPLPRSVLVVEAEAATSSGYVTAVLTERVSLPCDEVPALMQHRRQPSPLGRCTLTTLKSKPLLLVGAGGIGCEVLKVLVLSDFSYIHLIDLDTIDATNLNRQFLFQLTDVGHSKAETACRVVLDWFRAAEPPHAQSETAEGGDAVSDRPAPHLVAYHDNIKAERFDDAFYRQFAAVVNALDNVAARQHVNRMCMRNNVPLVESGTMGYNGQVQPIIKGCYECYDCRPKPPDTTTFAVCTIHARPTTMVHCVHYAKELYEVLFGGTAGDAAGEAQPQNEGTGGQGALPPQPQQSGESELSYLRALVLEWRREQQQQQLGQHRYGGDSRSDSLRSAAQLGARLLRQLFVEKIEELLALKSSWSTEPPVPLDRAEVDRVVAAHESTRASLTPLSVDEVLSPADCMELFERAVEDCLARPPGVAFKKEDDAAVRFVSATANLRAHVFHISLQSVEEVRSIAGSIVPAIATTNAIIAAAVVHELVALLLYTSSVALADTDASADVNAEEDADQSEVSGGKTNTAVESRSKHYAASSWQGEADVTATPHVVYARKAPQIRRRRLSPSNGVHHLSPSLFTLLSSPQPQASDTSLQSEGKPRAVTDAYLVHSTRPNPPNYLHCLVCQDIHPEVTVQLKLAEVTLGQFVHAVLEDALGLEGPSVSHGATVLYEEEDYEALADSTLAQLLLPPPPPSRTTAVATMTSSRAQRSASPHLFVLHADALNKDVAWSVLLLDEATSSQEDDHTRAAPDDNNNNNGEGEGAAVRFTLSGLERARAAERHALARLHAQSLLLAEAVAEEDERRGAAATSNRESNAIGTTEATAEVTISDDDDEDVEEVVEKHAGRAASSSVRRDVEEGEEGEDDAVVVLDD